MFLSINEGDLWYIPIALYSVLVIGLFVIIFINGEWAYRLQAGPVRLSFDSFRRRTTRKPKEEDLEDGGEK